MLKNNFLICLNEDTTDHLFSVLRKGSIEEDVIEHVVKEQDDNLSVPILSLAVNGNFLMLHFIYTT